jgi:hypothetical protein
MAATVRSEQISPLLRSFLARQISSGTPGPSRCCGRFAVQPARASPYRITDKAAMGATSQPP